MKSLAVGAAALLGFTTAANADVTIRLTGSTAFRASTIAAIQGLMGAGNFKAAFQSSSGASTSASNRCIIQGTIPSIPSVGVVTIKCSWSGSTGGIKTVVQNIPVATWMANEELPGTNTTVGLLDADITYDAPTIADVTMEDSAQASTGFTSTTLTETRVGVIAFEWVVGNTNAPAAFDNITPLQAQVVMSGGLPLSQFTGARADANTYVYMVGRNFDSGTRLSALAETGVGVFAGVQHVQVIPTSPGPAAGANGSSINAVRIYPAEEVLGQMFSLGQSGYSSGGTIADLLATPGALTASTTSANGTAIPANAQLEFGAGHLISYLGRSDAARAVRTQNIATNTARRLKWNGHIIAPGAINANGTPVGGYNDTLITEGVYPLWEFQNLAYRSTYGTTSPQGKTVADAIAARITATDGALSGTLLSDMFVTKAVEGGVITPK